MYEKVGNEWEGLASLALWEARGASPQTSEKSGWRDTPEAKLQRSFCGALAGATPQSLAQKSPTFLLRFSSLNPLNFNGSFPKHLESLVPSIYIKFYSKNTTNNMNQSQENSNNTTHKNSNEFHQELKDLLLTLITSLKLNHDWSVGKLT